MTVAVSGASPLLVRISTSKDPLTATSKTAVIFLPEEVPLLSRGMEAEGTDQDRLPSSAAETVSGREDSVNRQIT